MVSIGRLMGNFQSPLVTASDLIRLSWQLHSEQQDVWQEAYQIQIHESRSSEPLYDSKKIISNDSVAVALQTGVLKDGCSHQVRVRVWTTDGVVTEFSEPLEILKCHSERSWEGVFISAETNENDKKKSDARYLRRQYRISRVPVKAIASVSALGLYEFFINGTRVGNHHFTPGWTAYQKRVLYQCYDVTSLFEEGENCLGAIVGPGWYKGVIGFECNRNFYGDQSAFFCQIDLQFADGTVQTLVSDQTWKWHESPVVFSELYDGETYDATKEIEGWNLASLDDRDWGIVQCLKGKTSLLAAPEGNPVAVIEQLSAQKIIETPRNECVIDFGQNLTGWVSFRVSGNRGDTVVIRHAEILDAEGNFYTENLRSAKQTIRYILKGDGEETFHPHFSFQGFRYICLDSYPGTIKLEHFTAQVVHSSFEEIGSFSCSNPLINQLQHNILWGLKGNFLDIPTDCPQRDERLGWTGDAQIFVPTACFLADTYAFFKKWLQDLALDQREDGAVSNVVPNVILEQGMIDGVLGSNYGSSAWGDAATIVPWTVYLNYGDTSLLDNQYSSMKAWVDFIYDNATDKVIWEKDFSFGDWVALDAKEGSYFGATPTAFISSAYYAYSAEIVAKSACVLGFEEDARHYTELVCRIKKAIRERFISKEGVPYSRTQTSCIVALTFDLLEPWQKKPTVDLLCELVAEHSGHLTTGFVGTPYICQALSDNGRLDEAYALLLKDDFPSWLYQVTKGATTIWEHWDGLKPDGSMWSPDMNSFNHYAYGAIGWWLYTVVAGLMIDPKQPGYKHVIIQPKAGGGLTHVRASHKGPYGDIVVSWECDEKTMQLCCTIPPNSSASLRLQGKQVLSSTIPLEHFLRQEDLLTCEIGSGTYQFSVER